MTRSPILLGCLLAAGCGGPAATGVPPPTRTARVVRVIDGDTIVLRDRGRTERVRLIGVDAPETWSRHDCYGAEATRALRRLTPPGSTVRVVGDAEPRDRYGRRLLYVWTEHGFVNALLVRRGFARAMAVPPDTGHAAELSVAEAAARREARGLWRACRRQ